MARVDGMATQSSNISIRKTRDIELIKRMNEIIFPGEPLNVASNTYHWIARDNETGKPIGFCSCSDIGHGTIFLSRAGVLRKYRGRGLQKKFIQIRERFCKYNEKTTIITYVSEDNYPSFVNLIKMNYKIYIPEWQYAGQGFFYFKKSV